MMEDGSHQGPYLAIDRLTANPTLVRRLPADTARRFHALPLAEDGGSVTVAMANPDDARAREAIAAALGRAVCLVQADPCTIDALLAQVWGADEDRSPESVSASVSCLWACGFGGPLPEEMWRYAQMLASLLGAHAARLDAFDPASLSAFPPPHRPHGTGPVPAPNLVVAAECRRRFLHSRCLTEACIHGLFVRLGDRAPFAVVVAPRPRWPLHKLLLVVCGCDGDRAALQWVSRLAYKSGSEVTVLAVIPPAPAMYGGRTNAGQDLPALLTGNTRLGREMRTATQHLVDRGIRGTLRLRQGPPDWQICREIEEGGYDLVGIAAGSCSKLRRWLEGDLIGNLLSHTDRPILVAGSGMTTA